MTHEEREKIAEHIFKECKKIRQTKGHDYSLASKDCNRNFKSVANLLGLTPEQVLWVYYLKHHDAVTTFIKTGNLKGEPVEEKIIDMVNYLIILYSLLKENDK